jgi:hypothetical protein
MKRGCGKNTPFMGLCQNRDLGAVNLGIDKQGKTRYKGNVRLLPAPEVTAL